MWDTGRSQVESCVRQVLGWNALHRAAVLRPAGDCRSSTRWARACCRPQAVDNPPVFQRARAVVCFEDGPARRLVHRLKYSDRMELAKPAGRLDGARRARNPRRGRRAGADSAAFHAAVAATVQSGRRARARRLGPQRQARRAWPHRARAPDPLAGRLEPGGAGAEFARRFPLPRDRPAARPSHRAHRRRADLGRDGQRRLPRAVARPAPRRSTCWCSRAWRNEISS